jgi:1,4-alpha-glucan branching enzyme
MPPQNLAELIIYELHVGSLGVPSTAAGTFADAMTFLDRLAELGVNAVELLPVLEFDGDLQWDTGPRCSFLCRPAPAAPIN